MIGCVFGPIRSGKTYHTVKTFIIPLLQGGDTVVTNIAGIDKAALSAIWRVNVSNLHIIEDADVFGFWRFAENRKRVIFVIDEIQNFYGSSNYRQNKDSREELKIFLTKCGHDGHSVVYICQVPEMVHTDILRLTETFIQCAKLNFIKFLPSNRYTWIARKSYKTKGTTVLEQGINVYDPKVYVCYQSTTPGVTETKTKFDKLGFVPWKVIVPILLLLVLLVVYKFVFAPKPPVRAVASSGNNPNAVSFPVHGNTSENKRVDTVDGWYSYDGKIYWLSGGAVYAAGSDTGSHYGLHAVEGGGWVFCRPRALASGISAGFGTEMVSAGGSGSGGPATVDRSSLPAGGFP